QTAGRNAMPPAGRRTGSRIPKTQRLARGASVLFHPVPVMGLAAFVATRDGERGGAAPWPAVAITLLAAVAVLACSALQVRVGRWSHIDASLPHERAQLNRFASWLLLILAAVLAIAGAAPAVVAALGLSGLIVLSGHLLRGRLKSSLHVAFSIF